MNEKKEIVAYFPQWGMRNERYYVKKLEEHNAADKITVLNYAFAEPGPDSTGKIVPLLMNAYFDYQQIYSDTTSIDGIADDSTQVLRGHFNQLKKLKKKYPQLRIVISLGGWAGSKYFSDAVSTEENRQYFVNKTISMFINGDLPIVDGTGGQGVAKGIFDGVDIDWEYPVSSGMPDNHYNKNDKDNLTKLYKLFREKLDEINPDLLLTCAVPAEKSILENYNINEDQKYLNWYTLMTYDFFGGWDVTTGHLTNIISPDDYENENTLSLDKTVHWFLEYFKVSKDKIIPGAAFYGRGWGNVFADKDSLLNKSGDKTTGNGEDGYNNYCDLAELVNKDFVKLWDNNFMAPILYNKEKGIFWTYDDVQSVVLKSLYVDAYDLRGIMFWEISGDDSSGALINAIYNRAMPDPVFDKPDSNKHIPVIKELHSKIMSGNNIVLTCDVADSVSEVVKVDYFVDDKFIGCDAEAPFSWIWFNAKAGVHKIKAIPTDNKGIPGNEIVVSINIQEN